MMIAIMMNEWLDDITQWGFGFCRDFETSQWQGVLQVDCSGSQQCEFDFRGGKAAHPFAVLHGVQVSVAF